MFNISNVATLLGFKQKRKMKKLLIKDVNIDNPVERNGYIRGYNDAVNKHNKKQKRREDTLYPHFQCLNHSEKVDELSQKIDDFLIDESDRNLHRKKVSDEHHDHIFRLIVQVNKLIVQVDKLEEQLKCLNVITYR